ncbi:MAG: type IV toxin-antitoxin system AbiEi family antitoxin domain-containing protein [Chloroflexi bacterium]|nr:type IV toxin-antitoxin system AbiEi family antitoxin domain-containing protein [Chloroflexota bacterium]
MSRQYEQPDPAPRLERERGIGYLSGREQAVYLGALSRGLPLLGIREVQQLAGVSPAHAAALLARLHRKRALDRIGRGVYAVPNPTILFDRQHRGVDATEIIEALMRRLDAAERYYVGYQSAAGLHGAAHQLPMVLQVVSARRHRTIRVGQMEIRFYLTDERRLFGTQTLRYGEARVCLSDRERTAVDLVDRPDLGGGIEEVARTLGALIEGVDTDRLVAYADRFGRRSVAQRLGFLLDAVGRPLLGPPRDRLRSLCGPQVIPLEAGGDPGGPIERTWRVRVNAILDEVE